MTFVTQLLKKHYNQSICCSCNPETDFHRRLTQMSLTLNWHKWQWHQPLLTHTQNPLHTHHRHWWEHMLTKHLRRIEQFQYDSTTLCFIWCKATITVLHTQHLYSTTSVQQQFHRYITPNIISSVYCKLFSLTHCPLSLHTPNVNCKCKYNVNFIQFLHKLWLTGWTN